MMGDCGSRMDWRWGKFDYEEDVIDWVEGWSRMKDRFGNEVVKLRGENVRCVFFYMGIDLFIWDFIYGSIVIR